MIISASRRTDLPAFFSTWFMRQLKKGIFICPDPFNNTRARRLSFTPDDIECLVFWTKDPRPMLALIKKEPHKLLAAYHYYFHFTLNPYGTDLEKGAGDKDALVECFLRLSDLLGPERLIWRYDPIILSEKYSQDFHVKAFEKMAKRFAGHQCVISFLDFYQKVKNNLAGQNVYGWCPGQREDLAQKFSTIAQSFNIRLGSCAEDIDLRPFGLSPSACIDRQLIENLLGEKLKKLALPKNRPHCLCLPSFDVGLYNTCPQGCLYCYANQNQFSAEKNYRKHDSVSDLILGKLSDFNIVDLHAKSFCLSQKTLF